MHGVFRNKEIRWKQSKLCGLAKGGSVCGDKSIGGSFLLMLEEEERVKQRQNGRERVSQEVRAYSLARRRCGKRDSGREGGASAA